MSRFDPSALTTRGYLPHLHLPGITQFVTFRVEASPYPEVEMKWGHPTPRPASVEGPLRHPRAATLVQDALRHFDGRRYNLHAWCVMPTHVHVMLTPDEHHPLGQILHSWKSFTANGINKLMGQQGRFWQHESFDQYLRDEAHFWSVVEYVELNPVVAGLITEAVDWPYSSAGHQAPCPLEAGAPEARRRCPLEAGAPEDRGLRFARFP